MNTLLANTANDMNNNPWCFITLLFYFEASFSAQFDLAKLIPKLDSLHKEFGTKKTNSVYMETIE
jgi:hypothetical protein